jgi:hypothetical protein
VGANDSFIVRLFVDGTIDTSFPPLALRPASEPEGRAHTPLKAMLSADERSIIVVGMGGDTTGADAEKNEDVWVSRVALP